MHNELLQLQHQHYIHKAAFTDELCSAVALNTNTRTSTQNSITAYRLFWVFNYFILPCRKFVGPLTQVKQSSCKSSAIHSYQCVQYFRVSKQWYGWVYKIFNVHTDVSACDWPRIKYRPCNFCWTNSAFRMVCWEKWWSVIVFLRHKSSNWRS